MILETKLINLDNKPIKVNKKSPPMSINKDLTPLYFTAMFIGAKNNCFALVFNSFISFSFPLLLILLALIALIFLVILVF